MSAVEAAPYDFLRPALISRERQLILDGVHARFAHGVQSFLSARLMVPIDVVPETTRQVAFRDYQAAVGAPCASWIYSLGEVTGSQGSLDLGRDFSNFCIDRLFGGSGAPSGNPDRSLTPLEQSVLGNIADRTMTLFQEAWHPMLPMEMSRSGFTAISESIRIAAREDRALMVELRVVSGGDVGRIRICVPLVVFEVFLQEKASPILGGHRMRPEDVASARATAEAHLMVTPLSVVARLPEFPISASEVAAIVPGRVIKTSIPADGGVEIAINGRRLLVGRLGRNRGCVAVQVQHAAPTTPSSTTTPRWRIN